MYVDFVGLAMDQISNQMAKWRYMSGGKVKVPMVLRTQGGTGRSAGAQHSQSLETWLAHVPGLRVVMPSNPADAKGLLTTAIRSDDPVVFIEHKALYAMKGEVPDGEHLVPFGKAAVARTGGGPTIISYSRMVHTAMEAAATLAKEGIEAEVIDLRTLNPLDMETVLASVRKTGRVVIAHEATKISGFGGEIAAQISERAIDSLEAPIIRAAGFDTPFPYALENTYLPSPERVLRSIKKSASY